MYSIKKDVRRSFFTVDSRGDSVRPIVKTPLGNSSIKELITRTLVNYLTSGFFPI